MFDFTGSPKLYITLFQESFFGGFPDNSVGKKFACNAGDLSSIPGLGRSPGKGKGYPLQHSGLEFHGLYSPWRHKESDTTEQLSLSLGKEERIYPLELIFHWLEFITGLLSPVR